MTLYCALLLFLSVAFRVIACFQFCFCIPVVTSSHPVFWGFFSSANCILGKPASLVGLNLFTCWDRLAVITHPKYTKVRLDKRLSVMSNLKGVSPISGGLFSKWRLRD